MASKNAEKILSKLISAGFEAYLVGGCVRDTLMCRNIHDYDITTNALPDEIMRIFDGYRVVPTGLKHGTVTVLSEGIPFEITTYRVDGDYSDGRRPDIVRFTTSLTEDLARRDFTMNAIAMDINGNIIDPFCGVKDIKNRLIRCVGVPEKRFGEDALRIMRAVRFAAQLGFEIEGNTADALSALRERLDLISVERIRSELDMLICGANCVRALLEYSSIITQIIPEFKSCIGFCQHSPYHRYDVWEHTVRAVDAIPADNMKLRRVMLFHDIGKPETFTRDENGRGHFKGHEAVSAEMTGEIMRRLHYDNKSVSETLTLIKHHSDKIHTRSQIKKKISAIGAELFFELLEVKKADNSAKQSFVMKEVREIEAIEKAAREIVDGNECCTLSQLAVNGSDLSNLGIIGRKTGETLRMLLEMVIDEKLPNEKDALLEFVKGR